MPGPVQVFRFRPRVVVFPWALAALGLLVLAVGLATGASGPSLTFAIACGVVGPLVGGLYLLSPSWRLRVIADDLALEVRRGEVLRFRLPYTEVRRLLCVTGERTCLVDGGEPQRSLLVPGPGAPAPYRLERREALYELLRARIPADRVEEVATLEKRTS